MFADRRKRMMEKMGTGVALVFAAPEKIRSNDTEYKFRQDSTFHYLTGFGEPGAAALLMPGHPEHKFVMFVRPRDPERETWDGRRAGPEGAVSRYGADAAFPIEELSEKLPGYLENAEKLFYAMGNSTDRDALVVKALGQVRRQNRKGIRAPSTIVDPAAIVHEMRLLKTPAELEIMRRAAAITVEAHTEAMKAVRPGMMEYEVEAILEFVFRSRGASGPAYTSIVGSGENATILHYIENSARCREGEMLLIDAGAEVDGYSADVTRTFPVSGKFTPAQRRVYDVVLAAQMAAIDKVRPGNRYEVIHAAALRVLVEGLVDLGVLQGDVDKLIETEAYKPYYMHGTGHWLGLDVHDVGDYRNGEEWRKLEPGMVLTVEPGLYFTAGQKEVPEEYRGMGVRIEDDVLVTEGEPEVLTAAAPKTPEEVESALSAIEPGPVATARS